MLMSEIEDDHLANTRASNTGVTRVGIGADGNGRARLRGKLGKGLDRQPRQASWVERTPVLDEIS
jgi:hypothetical protein